MIEVAWLEVADAPELWASLGFVVTADGSCVIGGVEHRLVGPVAKGSGVLAWALRGDLPERPGDIDGLPTKMAPGHVAPPTPVHPNGVARIDHLVVRTPSTPRTTAALEGVGLARRGQRSTNSAGDRVDMTFFWLGDTIVELSGPAEPASDPGEARAPARFAGVAYASTDLDATVGYLGDRCTRPRDAVQAGRRIAALRPEAGSSMPMAFMSPHRRRRPGG